MAAMTDALENALLDWLLRGQAFALAGATAGAGTGPTALYFGLLTANPTDSTAGTEVTGGSYARVSVAATLANWAGTQSPGSTTASSGTTATTSNNNTVTFPAPTANWGTVTGMGLYTAPSAGSLLIYSALTVSKTVNNGDAAPSFAAAAFTFQLDN